MRQHGEQGGRVTVDDRMSIEYERVNMNSELLTYHH